MSGDHSFVPIRCTQNPTMGEEWRKGWHPERIAEKTADESVLIVGAGPAGLEAARALGQRGYDVTLADRGAEAGGRLVGERRLPGLAEWGRVVDHRTYQIGRMPNVNLYLESDLTPAMVHEFTSDHVILATGAKWVATGIGRENPLGIEIAEGTTVLTPDDIMGGTAPDGPVIVFDDDHYYMGGLIAEKLRGDGHDVTYVTPATEVSSWTHNTLEQHVIQAHLMEMGVEVIVTHNIARIGAGPVTLACSYTGKETSRDCATVVLVTMREPDDLLFHALADNPPASLIRIGDGLAPSTIAAAVYAGHKAARELGTDPDPDAVPFKRELLALSDDFPGGP